MKIDLTVTSVVIQPELNAVQLVITPTFTAGKGTKKTSELQNDGSDGISPFITLEDVPALPENIVIDSEYQSVKEKSESAIQTLPNNLVIDENYVHTDNNFTDEAKGVIENTYDYINTVSGFISDETTRATAAETALQTDKQPITDNSLNTTSKTVVGALNELKSRVDELPDALSFDNYSAFVTAFNAVLAGVYNVGQSVLIAAMNVPDIWVFQTSTFQTYNYTTDAQLITDLETGVHIGYYVFQPLETEKVNLSNYYTKTQIDGFLANYYTSTQIDTFLAGKQPTITPTENNTPVDTDYFTFQRVGVWFKVLYSDLKTNLALTFGRLSTVNTWALLQTFTSGVKTGKIQPIADSTTALQIMKADGVSVVMSVDTVNEGVKIYNHGGNKPFEIFYNGSSVFRVWPDGAFDAGGTCTLAIVYASSYICRTLNNAPTSSNAAGSIIGEIRYDANYMYLYIATNQWKRSLLTTW